ncbi:MAG: hypothetical protein H0U49_08225 [Parachlamydiaceae bacterium]|nr:hypothetical protein [Parachlamydiaceae bacterium]
MINNMRITISERFKPFTHLSGSSALLPFSTFCCEVYPALIRVYNLEGTHKKLLNEIPLNVNGIVEGFTMQQDIEKGCLKVWGKGAQGYFRYRIQATDSGKSFKIITEKEPAGTSLFVNIPQTEKVEPIQPIAFENLSFGISKSQDWAMVLRRQKMMEILPFWFRLGQLVPSLSPHEPNIADTGTLYLLKDAYRALEEKDPEKLIKLLEMLFLAGFEGLLVPRMEDDQKQGLNVPPLDMSKTASPLTLLSDGKNLIKRMIIDRTSDNIQILPCLPAKFHCGRMLNVRIPEIGFFNLEWSKKTIRRICFQPCESSQLTFQFPNNVKTFRLRRHRDGSTQPQICGQPIGFSAGERYLFDNFKR